MLSSHHEVQRYGKRSAELAQAAAKTVQRATYIRNEHQGSPTAEITSPWIVKKVTRLSSTYFNNAYLKEPIRLRLFKTTRFAIYFLRLQKPVDLNPVVRRVLYL